MAIEELQIGDHHLMNGVSYVLIAIEMRKELDELIMSYTFTQFEENEQ
jgi:hypothetical protein